MTFMDTELPGCYVARPHVHSDERGLFIKTYHAIGFRRAPFRVPFEEEYVTTSHKGVLRGLHLQIPPKALDKVVLCVHGVVLDAVLDVRRNSPKYGRHILREMRGDRGDAIFVPKGCAHGFYTLSETAVLVYKTSVVHDPACDKGIHWASAGIDWPDANPMVSVRDRELPSFAVFRSPFDDDGD